MIKISEKILKHKNKLQIIITKTGKGRKVRPLHHRGNQGRSLGASYPKTYNPR